MSTTQEKLDIAYDALRAIDHICPDTGADGNDAYRMANLAHQALDNLESDPPKTLEELRAISLAVDRVANCWSDKIDTCTADEEREVWQQYFAASELSRAAFRAYVDHPQYRPLVDEEV
jgi:hypothetical protein